MESVLIIAPAHYELDTFRARLPRRVRVEEAAYESLAITDGQTRAYLRIDLTVEQGLEPDEATAIRESISKPRFFVLDYSDIELCKALLRAIADDDAVRIDNDHGRRCRGPEFLWEIRRHPEWDWRISKK
jgi:hypothetical protein